MADLDNGILQKYGVSNVSRLEEYVHISRPDKFSLIYQEFLEHINTKVGQLAKLLTDHGIRFSSNEFINGHLYRLYIIDKDILLDFELYPVPNGNYNYIRVNYDQDIELLYKSIFPVVNLEPETLEVWDLTQRINNHFLRSVGQSPVYYKDAIRLGIVKDGCVLQTMTIRPRPGSEHHTVISNVVTPGVRINLGTMWLLRYFKEVYGIEHLEIKSNRDNSIQETLYQLMDMKLIDQQYKKKIWWSPTGPKWHVKKEHTDEYVPFYFTEKRVWLY